MSCQVESEVHLTDYRVPEKRRHRSRAWTSEHTLLTIGNHPPKEGAATRTDHVYRYNRPRAPYIAR